MACGSYVPHSSNLCDTNRRTLSSLNPSIPSLPLSPLTKYIVEIVELNRATADRHWPIIFRELLSCVSAFKAITQSLSLRRRLLSKSISISAIRIPSLFCFCSVVRWCRQLLTILQMQHIVVVYIQWPKRFERLRVSWHRVHLSTSYIFDKDMKYWPQQDKNKIK